VTAAFAALRDTLILTPAYVQDAKIAKKDLNQSNQQNQLNQLNNRSLQWQIRAWKVICYPPPSLALKRRPFAL
jgi:hypothetical protein